MTIKGLIVETDILSNTYPFPKFAGSAGLNCYKFPLIYFPVSFMLRRGVKDITLALTRESIETAQTLFSSGRQLGVNIRYKILDEPSFLAREILEDTEHFRGNNVIYSSSNSVLWGKDLRSSISDAIQIAEDPKKDDIATIFGKYTNDCLNFETMTVDLCSNIIRFGPGESEVETSLIVPKVGIYPKDIVEVVESLSIELIDEALKPINNSYLRMKRLEHIFIHSDELWFQVNCFQTLNKLSKILEEYATKHRIIIGSPERSAFQAGLINQNQFEMLIKNYQSEEFKDLLRYNI